MNPPKRVRNMAPEETPHRQSVLVVEDDAAVASLLERTLSGEGYEVHHVESGEDALDRLERRPFSIMVLDVGLPGMDGFQVLERVRSKKGSLPILMLTAEDSEESIVQGLRSGAEDYVVKPFSVPELLARIEAVLRRSQGHVPTVELRGGLAIDLVKRWVKWRDRSVRLTNKELAILWTLASDPGRVIDRKELLERVWGFDFDPGTTVFDVHLSRLRKKLASIGPPTVETVWGKGYRFQGVEED
jgi:DNA-binding response OmpR family regulator